MAQGFLVVMGWKAALHLRLPQGDGKAQAPSSHLRPAVLRHRRLLWHNPILLDRNIGTEPCTQTCLAPVEATVWVRPFVVPPALPLDGFRGRAIIEKPWLEAPD
jgi:hypothetical protein